MLKRLDYEGNYEEIAKILSLRKADVSQQVNDDVQRIIDDIKRNGDKAVIKYCSQLDGFKVEKPSELIVKKQEILDAVTEVGKDFMKILEKTKGQITEFHQHQVNQSWSLYKDNGVIMGQIVRAIENVALYVPGGTATYPSTVLMNAIPAKLAGVKNMVIITPVKEDGKVNATILAAAYVCGIKRIYKVGGAHGVAAVALGTKTLPRVDKIVGPGNIYVATAKKNCYGMVDIDMIAGPSEIVIIADEDANPKYIAADLMSQAEHDPLASAILVTTSPTLIDAVDHELHNQIQNLSRETIIRSSLDNYGGAILVKDLKDAFEVSNFLAPEHLEVLVNNPLETLPLIHNAGSIFLGEYTPEPLGDYMSGTNHVLPTNGTARFYSALGVYDFVKWSSYSYYPKNALQSLQEDVRTFANLEGLDAHANSIAVRFEEEDYAHNNNQ